MDISDPFVRLSNEEWQALGPEGQRQIIDLRRQAKRAGMGGPAQQQQQQQVQGRQGQLAWIPPPYNPPAYYFPSMGQTREIQQVSARGQPDDRSDADTATGVLVSYAIQ